MQLRQQNANCKMSFYENVVVFLLLDLPSGEKMSWHIFAAADQDLEGPLKDLLKWLLKHNNNHSLVIL